MFKYIVAPVAVVAFSTEIIRSLMNDGLLRTFFLGLVIIPFGIFIARAVQLKWVEIEGDVLRISNFRSEITVPLTEIGTIKESRFPFPVVRLSFIKETPFGSRIVFAPTHRFFDGPHPIVDELWELREAALKKA